MSGPQADFLTPAEFQRVPNHMSEGRTIAIGDVHGCSAALVALVRAIDPSALDTLVFLGDYIDVAGASIIPDGHGAWKFNTGSSDSPVANVVWTDNRDVRPPLE